MALRRALPLRSLLSARSYKPSYSCITRHDDNDHEEKPDYRSFLRRRFFTSSILHQHLRSCSNLSLCTPVGVSIYHRSMSTSHIPGADETGNVNDVAATTIDSMMENVASDTPDWSIHLDVVQRLVKTVHSFTGLDWWASVVITTFLIRGMTIPLMINQAREWSRMMKLAIHSTACAEIRDQGGDLLARHQTEFDKLVKEYGGVFSLSPFLPILQIPALVCMGLTVKNLIDILDYRGGFEGSLIALKKLSRYMVIPLVVGGLVLSKEVHCYLMSCMLFSIAFMHVIRRPGMKKHLGIPEVLGYMVIKLHKNAIRNWL